MSDLWQKTSQYMNLYHSLQELTLVQLQAFTDVQAGSVTAKQRASMSASQIDILDKAATGGEEQRAEVTGAPPSAGMSAFPSLLYNCYEEAYALCFCKVNTKLEQNSC